MHIVHLSINHKVQNFLLLLCLLLDNIIGCYNVPFFYTGLTRAKQSLVLLGEQEAFDIGLKQMDKHD